MNNKSVSERLNNINDRGPNKWLSNSLREDALEKARDDITKLGGRLRKRTQQPQLPPDTSRTTTSERPSRRAGKKLSLKAKETDSTVKGRLQSALDDVLNPPSRGKAKATQTAKNLGFQVTPNKIVEPDYQTDELEGRGPEPFTNRTKQDPSIPTEFKYAPNLNFDKIEAAQRQKLKQIKDGSLEKQSNQIASAKPTQQKNNWAELAVAGYFHDNSVRSREDLNRVARELVNQPGDTPIESWLDNLNREDRTDDNINSYLETLHKEVQRLGFNPEKEDVYLRGEKHSNEGLLSNELSSFPKKKDKADVLFKDIDGKSKGISVKDDKDEYHVHTEGNMENLLLELAEPHGLEEQAQNVIDEKRRMYARAGLPEDLASWKLWMEEQYGKNPNHPKYNWKGTTWGGGLHPKYSELFKNQGNSFYTKMQKLIESPGINEDLMQHVINNIFLGDEFPYEMFKFNGDSMKRLHKDEFKDGKKSVKRIGPTNKGGQSSAAATNYGYFLDDSPFLKGEHGQVKGPMGHRSLINFWQPDKHILRPFS